LTKVLASGYQLATTGAETQRCGDSVSYGCQLWFGSALVNLEKAWRAIGKELG